MILNLLEAELLDDRVETCGDTVTYLTNLNKFHNAVRTTHQYLGLRSGQPIWFDYYTATWRRDLA